MSTYTMQYMNAANTICALMTLYLINSTSMHKLYMCGICTAHAIYAICFNIYLSVSGASFPNLLGSPLTAPTNPTTITTFTLTLLFLLTFFSEIKQCKSLQSLLQNHMFTRQLSPICQPCISQKPMTLLYTALLLHHSLCISRIEYELNYFASAPIYSGFKTLHQFPLQYIMM